MRKGVTLCPSRRIALSLAIPVAALFGISSAYADSPGWYLGASLGSSSYGSPKEFYPVTGSTGSVSASGSATGKSIFAGYRFTDYFAVEPSYFDMGEVSITANESVGIDPVTLAPATEVVTEAAKETGVALDAIFQTRGEGFGLYGRLGFADASITPHYSANSPITSSSSSYWTYDYGFGLSYSGPGSWAVRLGWTQFAKSGNQPSGAVAFTYLGVYCRL